MKGPSTDSLRNMVREFIQRTSNDAMKTFVCACCASEKDISNLTIFPLDSIPNPHLLVPIHPHPEHKLFRNMLLEPKGVDVNGNMVNLCGECHLDLHRNNLPPLALANNMWIGPIPDCLEMLTLAERILIAKYFPTAYIIKMFPKQAGSAHWDKSKMYSGFKGCVSTYTLDPKLVASMIDGKILPAPPAILSATVAVTFITPSGKKEFSLPDLLRVRRHRVREALLWLKVNNPLYHDIVISEERLQSLPEDDIPQEIRETARHSTDIEAVIREHDGYVPTDTTDEAVDEEEINDHNSKSM